MSWRRAALGLVLLAGCVAPLPEPPVASFVTDSAGLAVAGSPLRIDFGRAPSGAIAALTRELGPPERLAPVGCPGGIAQRLRWGDLELTFTREQFVGWRRGGAAAGSVCG